MTGRHFRPPPWRAMPAPKLLAAAKEPGLPRPRNNFHGRGPKPSPFLGLGLGTLQKEMEVAAPYSRPTGNSSPVLPVPDVRDAAREGGNPPAAGVLPASSHHPPPLRLLAVGGSKPSPACRRSAPVSPPSSSSADFTPPVYGPQQRLQFCGLAAVGSTPSSLSGPRSTPATPRGSSLAGLRPPVFGTYPRLRLRDLAVGGSPLSSTGHRSPATLLPRSSSDTVRHAFLAGGSFRSGGQHLVRSAPPVTGLGRVFPVGSPDARMATVMASPSFRDSCPGMQRRFSTLPPPVEQNADLMVAEKTWKSGMGCPFPIQRPGATEVKNSLELDKRACQQFLNKAVRRKDFETKVKPALLSRCLLSQYPLSDPKGLQLHHEYKGIISHFPRYMTSLELMDDLESMIESNQNAFLDHLSEDRAIIVEDWENRLGASAGATIYDHSVLSPTLSHGDDSLIYKGECDSSFDKINGKAKLCIIIWCRDKVLSCKVVEDFECKTSVLAEATAMYLLLKEGVLLGLNDSAFKACTDCDVVYRVLWGAHRIDHNDESSVELYKLLKFMRRYYKKLIPKLEPREKMMFVDGLMRVTEKDEGKKILAVLRKLELDLGGHPIFKFTQKSAVTDKLANDKAAISLDVEKSCYLEVEEKHIIDAAYHVIAAMRPQKVVIIGRDIQSQEEKLLHLFEDCDITVERMDGNCSFWFSLRRVFHKMSGKILRIVLDDTLPVEESSDDDSIFTVFLTRPNGIKLQLPELSPFSFVSFHQAPKRNKFSGMKESEKQKAVQSDGYALRMPKNGEKDNCK